MTDVGLADAREKASAFRKQYRAGVNPLDEKQRERLTFEQVARQLHSKEAPTWTTSNGTRWLASLESYAFPKIGNRPVEAIRRPNVVEVLEPINARGTKLRAS